uniref:Uncharacterized protein n=1 Tax=Panagrolaimus sp. ES5 TaxID=591445 RepID=A0AC34FSV5_9BILA
MENEWNNVNNLHDIRDVTKLWIPLNAEDSLNLENAWRRNKECSQQIEIDAKCRPPTFETLMKQEKVSVMKGSYKAYLKDDYGYLSPYFWTNERERWMVMRGEWIYEIPKSPPSLYFMEIKSDPSQEYFYQPVPSMFITSLKSYAGYLKLSHGCPTKFNDFETNYSDLLFVVHGIGHHKGEEDIVQNGYDENEKNEVLSFYNRINCDRRLGKNHDAFLQFESATYQYAMDFYKNGNKTLLAQVLEQFDKNFGKRIIWNNETTTKMIEPNEKIPHRLDFDISKTEYSDLKHMEAGIERKFSWWTKELLLSHLSYWNRPEVIALMTNIIYNFDTIPSCNNTVSPYIRRHLNLRLSWNEWFKQFFTYKIMRWIAAFGIGYLVFCITYAFFDKSGRLAGYISLSVVLTALWLSWSYISKHYYFYEVLWVSWICFYRICQTSATGMLIYYAWIKSEGIRQNYTVFIFSTILPFIFGALLWYLNFSIILSYIIIPTLAVITIIWPFLIRQLIQIYACFAVVVGLWCLTDPGEISRIALLFGAPEEYVFAIYIVVFIPAILNLLITETQPNIDMLFRFIYNFVFTLLALTAIKAAYIELAALSRNYELDCRNPTENGRCLEYLLYNTETKLTGPSKTTLSAISDFISPFLHGT